MKAAPIPAHDQQRLRAPRELLILDTLANPTRANPAPNELAREHHGA